MVRLTSCSCENRKSEPFLRFLGLKKTNNSLLFLSSVLQTRRPAAEKRDEYCISGRVVVTHNNAIHGQHRG